MSRYAVLVDTGSVVEPEEPEEPERPRVYRRPHYHASLYRSYGVACCRRGPNGRPEVIIVQKRYTYQYIDFLLGNYYLNDTRRLRDLFSGMTFGEKTDILSLDFEALWTKLWLGVGLATRTTDYDAFWNASVELKRRRYPVTIPYESALDSCLRRRFAFNALLNHHKGNLIRLIEGSPNGSLSWEMPKGRPAQSESDVDCATREFCEETGIPRTHFRITSGKPITETYTDDRVTYVNTFYIAVATRSFEPRITFRCVGRASETAAARWLNYAELSTPGAHNTIPLTHPVCVATIKHILDAAGRHI